MNGVGRALVIAGVVIAAIGLVVIAADRFVIAATVSVGAVAFYVTPYEVITKGWILSASLMAAMFPLFSALSTADPGAIRGTCRSAELWLLAVAAPAVAFLLGSADLLLQWWLGDAFRENASNVARLLALGLLVNVVAQVPLTALNVQYSTPFTVRTSWAIGVPPRVSACSEPVAPWTGSIACSPLAALAAAMWNVSVPPTRERLLKEDALRPSVHSSSCRAEMIGTPRLCAASTMSSCIASVSPSEWMFATKAP